MVATAEPTRRETSWVVSMIVLITGMFMSLLDTSIINVALPTMANDFGVDIDEIEWVVTAYNLALGVVVPLSGWLADRVGLTRLYLWALIAFSLVSALCGLAWNLESEVAFRILQAIPGGILPVVTLLMVYRIVPREKLGAAMGMYGVGIAVAPAIGPTLGGYLVEYVDWRLVFYINVPVGFLGAVAAYLLLTPMPPTSNRRFDTWGFLAIAYGLFALLLACSEGNDWGWTSYRVLILVVSGVLSLALFVVIQLERDEPLIDMRVFGHWPFVNSLLLITVLSVGLFSMLIYLPIFMQEGMGITPLHTGFLLLPEALVIAFCMPIAGLLYDRFGPRWPATIGLTIAAYGTYLLSQISPSATEGEIVWWTCVRAVGNGLALMPIFTAGLASIPQAYASSGSTMNNIAQRVSGSIGVAALTILVTTQQDQLMADRSALMPATDPELAPYAAEGFSGVYGLYHQLQVEVMASAYADAFLAVTVMTIFGIGLALMMPKPAHPDAGMAPPAAVTEPAEAPSEPLAREPSPAGRP
jgi:EmrB/QacA subfamily drug resistance transporter